MSYKSPISSSDLIIDDSNYLQFAQDMEVNGELKTRGLIPRPADQPFGSLEVATPFDLPSIPRDQWEGLIEKQDVDQTSLIHLCDLAGLTVCDQDGTNYCWIFAPTHALEVVRVQQNQPMVRLSPASVGCKIKDFRNNGGWGSEGLKYLIEHGAVPVDLWPQAAINRKYDTPAADAQRSKYKVIEWYELRPRRFEQLATCLLLNIPVALGLNWWSHEVLAMRLRAMGSGKFGVEIDNSWSEGWGNKGRGILTESKATPDDAVAPRSVTPSSP